MLKNSPPYRNRKLLDLAHRVHECQLLIPCVCVGYALDGCEPAHADWSEYGKGMGRKAEDFYHVASCHACHLFLSDGRTPREIKKQAWLAGWRRTIAMYFREGWLCVR